MNIGDKFGNWTVIDQSQAVKSNAYKTKCVCVCGNIAMVNRTYLITGKSKSCGCFGVFTGVMINQHQVVEIKHSTDRRTCVLRCKHGVIFESRVIKGSVRNAICPCDRKLGVKPVHGESPMEIRTTEYNRWRLMRQRCNNKNHKSYKDYGGRGIKVCERWDDFRNFLNDMGRCPPGYSIDRINNDGNYEPSNCRWADSITQRNNQRRAA